LTFLGVAVHPFDVPSLYQKYYPEWPIADGLSWSSSLAYRVGRWIDGNPNPMRWIRHGERVLEVGSGIGSFLSQARSVGASAVGIEIDGKMANALKQKGYNVFCGTVEEYARTAGEKFDTVVLSQVLEHMYDPVGTMHACRELLVPRGRVIISTPSLDSVYRTLYGKRWLHWHVPYHVSIYSRRAMCLLAQKTGFRVSRIMHVTSSTWFLAQRGVLVSQRKGGSGCFDRPAYSKASRLLVGPLLRLLDGIFVGDCMIALLQKLNPGEGGESS
jgi:SAM-dependent methyltransferase